MSTIATRAVRATVSLILLTGLAATAAAREEDDTVREIRLSTHGVDLVSPAGRQAFEQRIEQAARSVCGLYDRGVTPETTGFEDCYYAALGDAHAQLRPLVLEAKRREANREVASAALGPSSAR